MSSEKHPDNYSCLYSHLSKCHSTEYSWHNLTGTPLESVAKAAVLVPLVVTDSGIEVWLTKRSENVRNDKGDISFPGGMKDLADSSAVHTSLREASEEIGLRSDQVYFLYHCRLR